MIINKFDKDLQNKLFRNLELVIDKNNELNLTRIDSFDKGVLLHLEDSLSCLDEFMSQDGPFLDLGTGGGFPGIPLAIVSGRPGVLIDSIQKKARAVQEIIEQLGLQDQIQALGIRSEEYAKEVGEAFNTVVVRAVSSFPVIQELASPLLVPNGKLIALKAHEDESGIEHAVHTGELLGFELESYRTFKLDDSFDRSVFTFIKTGEPSIKLPRRPGMAQKRPLS